jgi:fatty acid-binding protein DegV
VEATPRLVNLPGSTYFDGINLSAEELFQLIPRCGKLPQTAAPSVASFSKY